MRRINVARATIGGTLLVLAAAGCAAKRGSQVTFHEPNMDFSLVHTVAVMPFANMSTAQAADKRVRDVFMTMLQATGQIYVLPMGEVQRGLTRVELQNPTAPSAQDVVALAKVLTCDAVITGSVLEYGEARSGSAAANYVSMSVQMLEATGGKLVWSAQSTRGGVSGADRMFGGGGQPMNVVTAEAVNDLLDKLFAAK
jgi:polysaccharide biosynthesis protein PelC